MSCGLAVRAGPQIGQNVVSHPRAHAAGIDQLTFIGIVAEQQRPEMRPRSFRLEPAEDNELLAVQRVGFAPQSAISRRVGRVDGLLSPSSAQSDICAWEVAEATRLGKRIIPVLCRALERVKPPQQLADRDYIYFYSEPKLPGSGFGPGLLQLASALNTDFDWLREHTRYLRLAKEWEEVGKPSNRGLRPARRP
jgi:hypothetical protein